MRRHLLQLLASTFALGFITSCAGYQLGGRKPEALAGIERIALPMFGNSTQQARAEALATSAVADAMARDGTFRISGMDDADAVLEGRVAAIDYTGLRGTRFDTLLAEEFRNTVILSWELRDARNPTMILARGSTSGSSQLFRDPNLQTVRNNALNDAMENAAEALVSRLADGY